MKIKIFLLFIVGILYAANTYAELKHFLPRSNAVMSILDHKYWFEGDTVIESKRYTKVYRQYCSSETECGDLQYYAAVREDTLAGKIYCIQTLDGVERLLADFNVREGDRIILYSYTMTPGFMISNGEERIEVIETEVQIDNVDSVLINTQYRKRINSPYKWGNDCFFVEGIGNMEKGLFFTFDDGVADGRAVPIFLCLHIDNFLVYQAWDGTNCYLRDDGMKIKEINASKFKIYPSIVTDYLYMSTTKHRHFYKIYNSLGTLCAAGAVTGNTVSVSNLHPDIYYIVFYTDSENKIYADKFVKR
ncbi:hypothetical protein FACS189437_11040 [Bacteroidia bacterium]|nr:hypothetical protein FACS189437_11040 [Bacteroidia bacterium]